MDPITAAIITALAVLGRSGIKDRYDSLKRALEQKFGAGSELVNAVNRLEQSPDSRSQRAMLQEAIARSKASGDKEIVQIATILIDQLNELPGIHIDSQNLNIAGGDISIWSDESSTGSEPSGPGDGRPK